MPTTGAKAGEIRARNQKLRSNLNILLTALLKAVVKARVGI